MKVNIFYISSIFQNEFSLSSGVRCVYVNCVNDKKLAWEICLHVDGGAAVRQLRKMAYAFILVSSSETLNEKARPEILAPIALFTRDVTLSSAKLQ